MTDLDALRLLVATTLLRTWVSNTHMVRTEEGATILKLIEHHQARVLDNVTEPVAMADRAAAITIRCLRVVPIANKIVFIYALLAVLFAAANGDQFLVDEDDDLYFVMTLLRDIMDKVTRRNDVLPFSKAIISASEELARVLCDEGVYYTTCSSDVGDTRNIA